MKKGTQITLLAFLLLIGLVTAGGLGVWKYLKSTPPLHPKPQEVSAIADSTPIAKWAAATDQARLAVRASMSERSLPGVSVAVGIAGEIVWAEGFGWADIEKRITVTPGTRFRIGTASTALTSAAAGLLIEQNRLKLDERIQTYVPEFPEKEWPVTVRQVMGNVAGIRTDDGDEGPLLSEHCNNPVEGLSVFAKTPLRWEPETDFAYSSLGWILVSAAIERAAGQPILEYMHKQIFLPLGMRDTLPESATEVLPERATPYFPRFIENPNFGIDLTRQIDYSCYSGASIFLSTPSDLVRFAMAVDSGKLLQPATVEVLQRSQKLKSGKETGYGLGWDLETVTVNGKQTTLVGHDGVMLGGMLASLMTFPEYGIVVAVTSNISHADTFGIGVKVAEAFASRVQPPAVR